jgi:hypothetical protein
MKKYLVVISGLFILVLQACGTPAPSAETEEPTTAPAVEAVVTEAPATLAPIVHVDIPTEGTVSRATAHDNENSANSGNKDVIFGDDFASNRFERPFTANDMNYLPDLDIVDFSITSDDNFFYIRIDLADVDLSIPNRILRCGIRQKLRRARGDISCNPPAVQHGIYCRKCLSIY